MLHTPLTEKHEDLEAKMVAFAGYYMPVYYSGIKDEHHAVRNRVGMFDVSHMGEFRISGTEASDFLQYIGTNDITRLYPGKALYNCMTNEQGGIIDDLLIYQLDEHTFMMVVNAANIKKDRDWINEHALGFQVSLNDISRETALIAVQGPYAQEMLQPHTDVDLNELAFYTFTQGAIAGAEDVIISATGYTGEDGFEFYCHSNDAQQLWKTFLEAGEPYGLRPAGLGARDTLRLEAGLNLYGSDMSEHDTPLEARMAWLTKLDTSFIGRDILAENREQGISRKLVGFELNCKGIPRHDQEILDTDENPIGIVTSGTQSPTLDKAIGMGYVKKAFAKSGTHIKIKNRNKIIDATVCRLPFYKRQ